MRFGAEVSCAILDYLGYSFTAIEVIYLGLVYLKTISSGVLVLWFRYDYHPKKLDELLDSNLLVTRLVAVYMVLHFAFLMPFIDYRIYQKTAIVNVEPIY